VSADQECVVEAYRRSLAALERGLVGGAVVAEADGQSPPSLDQLLVRVLLARDDLGESLRRTAGQRELLLDLARQDEKLRTLADDVDRRLGTQRLKALREARGRGPEETPWWWSLDDAAESVRAGSGATLWGLLAALGVALAVALFGDLSARFLTGGSSLTDWLVVALPVLPAVVTGSAFTNTGRAWLHASLVRSGLPGRHFRKVRGCLVWLIVIFLGIAKLGLPQLGDLYRSLGLKADSEGKLSDALRLLRRSVALAPEAAAGHYELGKLFEKAGRADDAISEYQRALEIDAGSYEIYNQLARLLILKRQDLEAALGLLDRAAELCQSGGAPAHGSYTVYKNRGWARLQLGMLRTAEEDLLTALAHEGGAEAHCLLAEVHESWRGKLDAKTKAAERRSRRDQARTELARCLKPGAGPIDPALRSRAEERRREGPL
jgi:Tfp pilus assembly protein PilF